MEVEYQSIPDKWKWTVLKYHVDLIVPMRDKPKELEGNIPWIRIGDFDGKYISGSKSGQGVSTQTVSEMNLKIFPPDTVLCSCSCSMGVTAIVERELISNQTFIGIYPKKGLSSDFLFYMMNAFSPLLQNESTGAIQQYLSKFDFGNIRFILPPLETQKQIADFLDKETTRIDTLIIKKQKQIELLQEKRQAIITQSVTKGLNPDAKMKDSGVEWIGEIPEHWETLPIKRLVSIPVTDGPHETPEFLDEGIPFVSAESVRNNEINFDKKRGYISVEEHQRYSKKYKPQLHDVYMIKSGATTGNCAIVETEDEFNIWSPLAVIRANQKISHPYFILYSLNSKFFQTQVQLGWSYGTQQNIGMNVIENLPMTVPPIEEQSKIVQKLDNEMNHIKHLLKKIQKSITLLKEYRSSLITHAVSGQIDISRYEVSQ